jgi:hypothetical protein
MDELPNSAKLARRALKIVLLPAVVVVGVSRFTPVQWYWLDFVALALVLVTAILVVVGRVFTSKPSGDQKGSVNS